jgi:hypothetical protein
MSRANLRKAGSYAGQSDAILAKVSPHRLALKLAVKYFRGFYVELIRDAAGNPTLLDSRPKHGGHTVTRAFVPPKLHGSLEALLTLPTQPASCGSTADFPPRPNSTLVCCKSPSCRRESQRQKRITKAKGDGRCSNQQVHGTWLLCEALRRIPIPLTCIVLTSTLA